MKLIDPDASFIFLETVYTRFHLDETHLLSFFINSIMLSKNTVWQLIY
jgi:hypothetical protein